MVTKKRHYNGQYSKILVIWFPELFLSAGKLGSDLLLKFLFILCYSIMVRYKICPKNKWTFILDHIINCTHAHIPGQFSEVRKKPTKELSIKLIKIRICKQLEKRK